MAEGGQGSSSRPDQPNPGRPGNSGPGSSGPGSREQSGPQRAPMNPNEGGVLRQPPQIDPQHTNPAQEAVQPPASGDNPPQAGTTPVARPTESAPSFVKRIAEAAAQQNPTPVPNPAETERLAREAAEAAAAEARSNKFAGGPGMGGNPSKTWKPQADDPLGGGSPVQEVPYVEGQGYQPGVNPHELPPDNPAQSTKGTINKKN